MAVKIPSAGSVSLTVEKKDVRLTNLDKPFWPELGITKGDLIQYYADVAPLLLPHIRDRAMVMKRYPHGAAGEFFFMKRAPEPRPEWIRTCRIGHDSGNVIHFPVIDDVPSLLVTRAVREPDARNRKRLDTALGQLVDLHRTLVNLTIF